MQRFIKVAFLVLFLAYYVDWLSFVTWSVWIVEIVTGVSDMCFPANPTLVKLFGAIEDRDLNRKVKIPATLMPEMRAEDYSFEALEVLSQNWRQPVVVRGLFRDTPAISLWQDPDYLINKAFFSNDTSVIQNGTIVNHYARICNGGEKLSGDFSKEQPFDATLKRILSGQSLETVVFPPASRSQRLRNAPLEVAWNKIIDQDLDLKRIGGTFAEGVSKTVLTQMFLGGGVPENSSTPTIGTGWHCDICNNFVVQVSGVKRWIMVDPIYSIYMRPTMRNGKTAVVGAHDSAATETIPYFPHYVVDLHPGDFLYNPEFYWHSIENHAVGPYSFGLVSRQCHLARNFKSSGIFTSLMILNHFVAGIYDPEARQRVWSAISGKSLMKPEEGIKVPTNLNSGGYTS
jgi:hypothetical protein